MTALFESPLLTIICVIFSPSILTYLYFGQVRKPILDTPMVSSPFSRFSILTALYKICSNDGLKYHKIPCSNSAGQQSLDKSLFPPESSLPESLFLIIIGSLPSISSCLCKLL